MNVMSEHSIITKPHRKSSAYHNRRNNHLHNKVKQSTTFKLSKQLLSLMNK